MSANNIFPLLLPPEKKLFHLADREISQLTDDGTKITSTPGGLQCLFLQRDHQIAIFEKRKAFLRFSLNCRRVIILFSKLTP